jgi:hypothetical protein
LAIVVRTSFLIGAPVALLVVIAAIVRTVPAIAVGLLLAARCVLLIALALPIRVLVLLLLTIALPPILVAAAVGVSLWWIAPALLVLLL